MQRRVLDDTRVKNRAMSVMDESSVSLRDVEWRVSDGDAITWKNFLSLLEKHLKENQNRQTFTPLLIRNAHINLHIETPGMTRMPSIVSVCVCVCVCVRVCVCVWFDNVLCYAEHELNKSSENLDDFNAGHSESKDTELQHGT